MKWWRWISENFARASTLLLRGSGTDHRFLWSVMPRWNTMPFTRRHLLHWIPEETPVFVTWRLAGSLPAGLTDDKNRSSVPRSFLQHDEQLDRRHPVLSACRIHGSRSEE